METIKEITKRDIYISEKNKVIKKIAELEIDILTLERTDPRVIVLYDKVVDKKGQESDRGRVPAEVIPRMISEKKQYEERLSAIEMLIKNDK
jgi:hypothetical protein